MQHIIDNLNIKLDLDAAENDDLKKQIVILKKKERVIAKLKKQVEQLEGQNQRLKSDYKSLQSHIEVHANTNSDLKDAIKKLDTELRKEKNHNNQLKQQINENSMIDGLPAFFEDDELLLSDHGKFSKKPSFIVSWNGDSHSNSPARRNNKVSKEEDKSLIS